MTYKALSGSPAAFFLTSNKVRLLAYGQALSCLAVLGVTTSLARELGMPKLARPLNRNRRPRAGRKG